MSMNEFVLQIRCRACDEELNDQEVVRKDGDDYLDLCNECFDWREKFIPEDKNDEDV